MHKGNPIQITLNLPDTLSQTETFNQSDWLREIAIALFQQERISLSRASTIAGMEIIDFQKLVANRGICAHYDVEDFEQDVHRGWLWSLSATRLPFPILPLSIISGC